MIVKRATIIRDFSEALEQNVGGSLLQNVLL